MCTEEVVRMMFTVYLHGNHGLDSRTMEHCIDLPDITVISLAARTRRTAFAVWPVKTPIMSKQMLHTAVTIAPYTGEVQTRHKY